MKADSSSRRVVEMFNKNLHCKKMKTKIAERNIFVYLTKADKIPVAVVLSSVPNKRKPYIYIYIKIYI